MSERFCANIRFLPTAEGGRSTPAMSGIRPHLWLGDILTSCIVHSLTSDEVFELGRDYNVALEIVFWDQYGYLIREDMPIELRDGDRVIARGRLGSAL
jgi:hypothetical protein